ncbi:hypothetical protein OG285_20765 [Streptomyces sp. NBC_01471]|uniref:hypothetical protein n=1 Tax=Streptomyces sp. NBC_01471 TaxID=2903879 RepID=UPI00324F1E46
MTVASTGKAPRTTGSAENEVLPLDVETISYSAEAALSMKMATSTREEIDGAAPAIIGHLNLLLGEDLGADEDESVRELLRKGYGLLDYRNRPTPETPAFGAFDYLKDAAGLTQRLLEIYTHRNTLDAP